MKVKLSKDVTFHGYPNPQTNEIDVKIDSLKYGQSKNFVYDLNTSCSRSQSLDYLNGCAEITLDIGGKMLMTNENDRPPRDYYLEQTFRREAIQVLNHCIDMKKYNDNSFEININDLITRMKEEVRKCDNVYLTNILFDLSGQVREALNMTSQGKKEDWFTRWGIHYLRSLQDAYRHELCNNFKDKGVSNFAGELFNQIRDRVSDTFDQLPPPKKDVEHAPPKSRGGSTFTRQAVPETMATYNSSAGPCAAEGCRVLMTTGDYKNVEDIRKGDQVITYHTEKDDLGKTHGSYTTSFIECVVKTKCNNNKANMVKLGELLITPYHPIIDMVNFEKDWCFPVTKHTIREYDCNYMYSFVTENRQSLTVERYIFATFGHKLKENIVYHEYFGTDAVINDLKKFNTYNDGYVELTPDMLKRDPNNKTVCQISMEN